MSARREELTRIAARLFAERGYQGTSLADLAAELGVQKPSLYHHIDSKEDLLWEIAQEGATAFHAALDAVPAAPAPERIRLALRAHLAVVAGQLDIATVFVREWRYLEGERQARFLAERRRYEERIRDSSAKASSAATCAPISTSRPPACSSSRPPTGPTRGCGRARRPTSSPIASPRPCSTGCAVTPPPLTRLLTARVGGTAAG